MVAVPGTDRIDSDTFRYHPVNAKDQSRGGFDLDLYFMWIPQSQQENERRKSVFEPMRQLTVTSVFPLLNHRGYNYCHIGLG